MPLDFGRHGHFGDTVDERHDQAQDRWAQRVEQQRENAEGGDGGDEADKARPDEARAGMILTKNVAAQAALSDVPRRTKKRAHVSGE